MSKPDPPRPPMRVPDHELWDIIGRGSYGEVWRARNIMGEWRAVKFVSRSFFGDDERPFEREFKGIRAYEPISHSHESLLPILHVGRDVDCFFYVMELADDAGGRASPRAVGTEDQGSSGASPSRAEMFATLDSRTYSPHTLGSEIKARGRLPVDECFSIGIALTTALEQLHKSKLVHRDVKPSNVVFVRGRPKLADIGLVTGVDATRSRVGTEGYIPPEGQGKAAADLYALGKVLYEASTGLDRQDFPALPPMESFASEERERFHELNAILLKACENDISKRYPTDEAMRKDLALAQAGKSVKRLRMLERRLGQALYAAIFFVVLGLSSFYFLKLKAAAMLEKLKQVEAREQMQRRQLLLQQMQMTRMSSHRDGWSAKVLEQIREAAKVNADANLRNQAAATLNGLDARLLKVFTNLSATSVAFDHEGRKILIGESIEGARLWDPSTDEQHRTRLIGPGPVAFAADGTPLAFVVREHGFFVLWNVAKQELIREFRIVSPLAAGSWPTFVNAPMAITADGSMVAGSAAFADGGGRYVVWESATGRVVLEVVQKIFSLAFSPDGSLLAAGDDDGRIIVWDLARGEKVAQLKEGQLSVRSLAFHRDLKVARSNGTNGANWLLAAGDESGTVNVWDVGARRIKSQLSGSPYHVYCLAFSPDGTLLASAGRYEARLWDVAQGKLLLTLPGGDFYSGIAFTPSGKKLAVSSRKGFGDGYFWLWDLESGNGIQTLRGLSAQVDQVRFSPNNKLIAAVANNWEIGIWEAASGRLLRIIEAPKVSGSLTALSRLLFSSDGNRIAFAAGMTASLYDAATGRSMGNWTFTKEDLDDDFFEQGYKTLLFNNANELQYISVRKALENANPAAQSPPRYVGSLMRLRNLIRPEADKLLPQITLTNAEIHQLIVPTAGESMIGWSWSTNNGIRERSIHGFSKTTLGLLWTIPWTGRKSGLNVIVDPAGMVVAYQVLGELDDWSKSRTQFVNVETGELLQKQNYKEVVLAISPGGQHWLANLFDDINGLPNRGGGAVFSLHEVDHAEPIFSLEFGTAHWNMKPEFSVDGNLLAWPNPDGTVLVCNLSEMQRRFLEWGLGW